RAAAALGGVRRAGRRRPAGAGQEEGRPRHLRQRQLRRMAVPPRRVARQRAVRAARPAGGAAAPGRLLPVRRQGPPLDLLRDPARLPPQPAGHRAAGALRAGDRAVRALLVARRAHPPLPGGRPPGRRRPHPRRPRGRRPAHDGAQHGSPGVRQRRPVDRHGRPGGRPGRGGGRRPGGRPVSPADPAADGPDPPPPASPPPASPPPASAPPASGSGAPSGSPAGAPLPPQVRPYLTEVVDRTRTVCGPHPVSVLAVGSLALGDYRHGRSDVDVTVVVDPSLPRPALAELAAALAHPALPCPAAGLELVLYGAGFAARPSARAGYLLDLNTGPDLPEKVSFDPDGAAP